MTTATHTFTRPELADYVRETFERERLVEPGHLVEELYEKGAPPEMIDAVTRLIPAGTRISDMRGLWVYLRDVPVERAET